MHSMNKNTSILISRVMIRKIKSEFMDMASIRLNTNNEVIHFRNVQLVTDHNNNKLNII